ncbi:hypothetical protein PHYBOEH_006404 [Phytophthora boehmeriae]|uniref:Glucokinase n=1 Tax=Phytophthora boehmeriae TaxID=109152 RepID=A0A8T1X2E2_9STRA|nr:hypothetical protein PHYBOEH_006404 [Phytophthora boehmeriae]
MTAGQLFAGVDIGGTGVKVGVVDSEGCVVARDQENYRPGKHEPQDVVDVAVKVLRKVLKALDLGLGDLENVGVGCPGVLEAGGVIHAAASFPSWNNVPLQQLITDTLGIPVTVCNDADAAILAEQWVGTAKGGVKDFIMLTLGTGIGFGVVANGQLVRGGTNAIEGGHMIIVLSGGIAEAGEAYIEQIRCAYAKHTWTKFPNPIRIEKASAGYDSGIIGAVAVCLNQHKGS